MIKMGGQRHDKDGWVKACGWITQSRINGAVWHEAGGKSEKAESTISLHRTVHSHSPVNESHYSHGQSNPTYFITHDLSILVQN